MKQENNKTYNIIVTGVGGQGLVTLLKIIARAALDSGFDVRASELHGLSQRGGSVSVFIRFGQKVFSPIIAKGKADLVLSLEYQESLAGAEFANKDTIFLINEQQTPTLAETISKEQVMDNLKKVSNNVKLVKASEICQKELGKDVTAGLFLLGLALKQNILPLSEDVIIEAVKKTMPEKYWDLNLKTLVLAGSFKLN